MKVKSGILIKYFTLLVLLLSTQGLRAERVGNLYEAEVPVVGQSAKARADGIKAAFARVMVKVSGDRALLDSPDIDSILNRASSYMQQYRYRSLGDASSPRGAGKPDRMLWVRFDQRAVDRLLRESGVPVWGTTRPSVLIWLGDESGTSRSLVSLENSPQLKHLINRTARERGLPVLLPLMDMQDRSNLTVGDLWGGFEADIRRASTRYQPDVILVGRLSGRSGRDWRGDWSLYLPDKTNRWSARGSSRSGVVYEAIQETADALALRFAPQQVSESSNLLRIRIHGLNHLSNYAMVKDYLESLAMIERLDLLEAGPESVSFLVQVRGGRAVLERGIQLGAVLEPVIPQEPEVSDETAVALEPEGESLDYRLR